LLLLRLFEDFSEAESPLSEVSLEDEFEDECSLVIGAAAASGAGTTTTGAG
jgi:hypothetical protein